MAKHKYKAGDKFSKWTLVEYNKEKSKWLAKCECGLVKYVYMHHLSNGKSKGCGKKECRASWTVGTVNNRTYRTWDHMKQRCLNKNNDRYMDYGGRGIKVCDEWIKFEGFLNDMGERPENHTIDRIDNNKGYYKENCRWATASIQMNNRRDNVMYKGELISIKNLARKVNLPYSTLQSRIYRGMSADMAVYSSGY